MSCKLWELYHSLKASFQYQTYYGNAALSPYQQYLTISIETTRMRHQRLVCKSAPSLQDELGRLGPKEGIESARMCKSACCVVWAALHGLVSTIYSVVRRRKLT